MQELIDKLQSTHGLSAEQAHGVLNTIKEFVKEKFPMVGGAIDSILPSPAENSGGTDTDVAQAIAGSSSADDIIP